MIRSVIASLLVLAAVPATAATLEAFSTFNGTQGTGHFTYGQYDGTAFSDFTVNTGCIIPGATCLQTSDGGGLPTASKSATPFKAFGTVNVPDDRLLLHPGPVVSVYAAYTAVAAGSFTSTATFSVLGDDASGVKLIRFYTPFGGATSLTTVGTLVLGDPALTNSFSGTFAAGDKLGYLVDKNGVYYGDSTGVNFAVTASVPEPATWGLMIAGFAMTGVGLRRRVALAA